MLRLRDHLEPREKNRKKKRVKEKKKVKGFFGSGFFNSE